MYVSILPKYAVGQMVGLVKGNVCCKIERDKGGFPSCKIQEERDQYSEDEWRKVAQF